MAYFGGRADSFVDESEAAVRDVLDDPDFIDYSEAVRGRYVAALMKRGRALDRDGGAIAHDLSGDGDSSRASGDDDDGVFRHAEDDNDTPRASDDEYDSDGDIIGAEDPRSPQLSASTLTELEIDAFAPMQRELEWKTPDVIPNAEEVAHARGRIIETRARTSHREPKGSREGASRAPDEVADGWEIAGDAELPARDDDFVSAAMAANIEGAHDDDFATPDSVADGWQAEGGAESSAGDDDFAIGVGSQTSGDDDFASAREDDDNTPRASASDDDYDGAGAISN
ncbi:MAG: hypothetical protein M0R66_07735 [Candidatus Omnitrophica bacterium]|nr:hypothetical protein [Candidatus Omnitrophota bacterium]